MNTLIFGLMTVAITALTAAPVSAQVVPYSQDFEARFHYQLPQRDIQVFAGWRYSEFTSTGTADGYQFENDLVLDGFQLGVLVTF